MKIHASKANGLEKISEFSEIPMDFNLFCSCLRDDEVDTCECEASEEEVEMLEQKYGIHTN